MRKIIFPIVVLILVMVIANHDRATTEMLPDLGTSPNFALDNSAGKTTSTASLVGSVWIAHFFFTSCQGPCPITSSNMELIMKRFSDNPCLKVVSFTMDPERDTPEALNEFGAQHHADPARWFFLRGTSSRIHDLLDNGFSVGSHDDLHFHTTRVVLVDRKGEIRGYYQATDRASIDKLISDAEFLCKETKHERP